MAELISSENSMHFSYKHNLFDGTQKVTPESLNFVTSDPQSNMLLKLSWEIKYSLTEINSYGTGNPNNNFKVNSIEINLLDKLNGNDTASVNINVVGQIFDIKFDSNSTTPVKKTISNLSISYNNKNNSLIKLKIHVLCENKKSISRMVENYNSYVKSEKSCNVILCVGEKKFSAHREILAAHSPVFASMFESDMLEKNEGKVQIKDIEPEILKYMIDYIYFAKVDCEDIANWLKLIVAADKYSIMTLVTVCEDLITKKLNAENVAEVFTISDLVKSDQLKKECVKFIVKNKAVVLKTDGYKNLVKTRVDLVSEMFSYIMLCCSLELEKDDK